MTFIIIIIIIKTYVLRKAIVPLIWTQFKNYVPLSVADKTDKKEVRTWHPLRTNLLRVNFFCDCSIEGDRLPHKYHSVLEISQAVEKALWHSGLLWPVNSLQGEDRTAANDLLPCCWCCMSIGLTGVFQTLYKDDRLFGCGQCGVQRWLPAQVLSGSGSLLFG